MTDWRMRMIDQPMNRRETQARQLSNHVMRAIDDHLPRSSRAHVFDALMDLFMVEGVDFVTEQERKELGLPPRGPNGWTADELVALERYRLELLTRPIFVRPTSSDINKSDGRKMVGKWSDKLPLDIEK